ncbi:hypothetical protein [uncultured Dokdonia sp.]|uniref:hypothetical protein n=1 Tax=uncultured Dokdonia sp. TaxID=575653 RepID=UPI0026282B2E|nr:hypothetical protein [uncultured Dokdonia sp.]
MTSRTAMVFLLKSYISNNQLVIRYNNDSNDKIIVNIKAALAAKLEESEKHLLKVKHKCL